MAAEEHGEMDRLIMRLGLGGIVKEPVHLSRVDLGGEMDRLIMRLDRKRAPRC